MWPIQRRKTSNQINFRRKKKPFSKEGLFRGLDQLLRVMMCSEKNSQFYAQSVEIVIITFIADKNIWVKRDGRLFQV